MKDEAWERKTYFLDVVKENWKNKQIISQEN